MWSSCQVVWFAAPSGSASVDHVLWLCCIFAASSSSPVRVSITLTLTLAQVQVAAPVLRPEAAHRAAVRGGGRADSAVHRHPVAAVLTVEQAAAAVQHGRGEKQKSKVIL